ncbi:oxidoreductase [Rhodobacterales bacterium 56_14_T64]|nr:oxidoreductase [Rhodobacterales bacterium 56_14_T64]
MSDTQSLLQQGAIGSVTVPNRFVLAPMSRASAQDDGTPTPNMARYYAKFARGGFGLLIAEGAYTDDQYSQSYSNQPGLVSDAHEKGWAQVVQAVNAEGGKMILQLIHAGAVSQHVEHSYAPSAVRPSGTMLQGYGHKSGAYDVPRELDLKEIDAIKQGFVQAAKRAENAGFDGVEVHCANGYLLDQFLTPETNLRTDQYGGSLENRIRLTQDIIGDIQLTTGRDFLVGVRLSQAKATNPDYFWHNGVKDAEVIFSALAQAGADFIHLASEAKGYAYHSATRQGENLSALAKKLTGLPVIANGGLHDAALANAIVSQDQADFIAVGKTAMLNPDLPKRIAQGRPLRDFSYDVFSYGVSIEAQGKWDAEQSVSA